MHYSDHEDKLHVDQHELLALFRADALYVASADVTAGRTPARVLSAKAASTCTR